MLLARLLLSFRQRALLCLTLPAIIALLFLLSCADSLEFEYEATIGSTDGSSGTDNSSFNSPTGLVLDSSGNLYVADRLNHRVQIFDPDFDWIASIGTGALSGDDEDSFNSPNDVAIDADGNIYIADQNNHRLQIYDSSQDYQATIGTSGEEGDEEGEFDSPASVAVRSISGEFQIYVADRDNHRIQIYRSLNTDTVEESYEYQYIDTIGENGVSGADNSQFEYPVAVAILSSNAIYVVDRSNQRLQEFETDTDEATASDYMYVSTLGRSEETGRDNNEFYNPADVAFDSSHRIYVADETNHRVQIFNSGRGHEFTIGEVGVSGSGNDSLRSPTGVAIGNSSRLYISDTGNHRIQIFRRQE